MITEAMRLDISALFDSLGIDEKTVDKTARDEAIKRTREASKRYHEAHRAEIIEKKRKRYAANAEKYREENRTRYRESGIYARKRDYYKAKAKEWREENRERKNELERERRKRPEVAARLRENYAAKREELNAKRRAEYARKKAAVTKS